MPCLRSLALCFVLVLGGWVVGGVGKGQQAYAQQTDPADDPSSANLPDLSPQRFEIRGTREINFPTIERQPLTGFETPPAVPPAPATHRPYVGTYKQERATLPQNPPAPPTTTPLRLASAPPAYGTLAAAGGLYLTRAVTGHGAVPLDGATALLIDASYTGRSGFQPEGSPLEAQRDAFNGRLGLSSTGGQTSFDGSVHGFWDQYVLYGLEPPGALQETPMRTGGGGGTTLALQHTGALQIESRLTYDVGQWSTDGTATTAPFTAQDLTFDFNTGFTVAQRPARFTSSLHARGLDGASAFSGDSFGADLGLAAGLFQAGALRVYGGLQWLYFSSLRGPVGATPGRTTGSFLAPRFTVSWQPRAALGVYVQNRPSLQPTTVPHLFAESPYLNGAPIVQPTLETTRLEGGVRIAAAPVRVRAFARYRYAPHFRFVTRDTRQLTTGLFRLGYESAQIIEGGASVALEGGLPVQASLGITLRRARLTEPDLAVPNVSPLTLDALVAYPFMDDAARVALQATVAGARYPGLAQAERTGAFIDLDVEGSYTLQPGIRITGALRNIIPGAQTYWAGYPQPAPVLMGGLQFVW